MRVEALQKYVGQVIVLDLIMGKEITTRIISVDNETKTVTCRKPRMFMPVPDPQNPQNLSVMALEYGHPMYKADDELTIDAEHVFTVFHPSQQQLDAYAKHTSGVVMASASSLDQLQGLDLPNLGK